LGADDLIEEHLGAAAGTTWLSSCDTLMGIGRENPNNQQESFLHDPS